MTKLRLYVLGPPRVKLDEDYIEIKPRKALALLMYLAVTAGRHSRDFLATLLWPQSDQRRARHSLRNRLSELNVALGGDWIEADRESVGLQAGFWLDAVEFQQTLGADTDDPHPLIAAADLYRGDFLAGFTLPDSPEFDEWQFFQTESLRQALAAVLERVVDLLCDRNDYETAVPYARRWLSLDHLHEPAHRQLMQLYAQTGQHAAALRQYDRCRQTLEDELGITPSPETRTLYQDIQAGNVAGRKRRSRPRHNLPVQTTTFISREAELVDITRLLLDEAGCRLVNLVGPGGIGKTRLAVETATQTRNAFPDGTYFVSLAAVGEVEHMVPAIAEALQFTFHGSTDPKDQLLDYLSQKRLLLLVDNFEHLLDGVDLLSEILSHALDITVLVTSRERLHLQEEWVYEVHGLAFPAVNDMAVEVLDAYPAVQLFLQRARQTSASFGPATDEMADIGRICRLLEGMPLGVELAAPWIRTLSCREIAVEIERSLDFLTTPLQNVPERHRSLRVVFEQTWQRLSQAEQDVLMQLSVFRGGCTREAAEEVTGATLPVLSSLVDKALLRRTNLGRYELHELIRQFAEMRLQTDSEAVEQAQLRHRDYFVAFLEARTAGVKGHKQKETLVEIQADIDNVRLAWRRAVADRNAEAIERSAECLFVYYLYSSGHYEGQAAFQQAAATFIEDTDLPSEPVVLDQQENLAGFLLAGQGYFLGRTRDPQAGRVLLEQALALLRRAEPRDRYKEGFARLWLDWTIFLQGTDVKVQEYGKPTLALLTETGNRWAEAWRLGLLGNSLCYARPKEAEEVYTRALSICRETGDQMVLGYVSHLQSGVCMELGRYVQAKQLVDQAVSVFEELSNELGLGYALMRRGQLAILVGKYRQAIQVCQHAMAYFNEVGTEANIIWVQIDLGSALRLHGDHSHAEQVYRQALETATARNHNWYMARCFQSLGCLAHDRDELPQAEQLQREALALWQQLELEVRVADVWRYLGQVLVGSGEQRREDARHYFRQALEVATELQVAPIALGVCVGVAQLEAQAGRLEHAVQLLSMADAHPASTFETKQKARRQLAVLVDQLPPKAVQAAQDKEHALELWGMVQTLLTNLTANTV